MKVLSLDLSTKTGWALFKDEKKPVLLQYGVVKLDNKNSTISRQKYPWSYRDKAIQITSALFAKFIEYRPNIVVIEEINLGRSRFSQKILDFIHFAILDLLSPFNNTVQVIYINTSEWRKILELKLTKKDKINNKLVKEAKKSHTNKKKMGIKGKITQKHLSVRFVNEKFNLQLKQKDNDIADAISLGYSYFLGAKHCDGR